MLRDYNIEHLVGTECGLGDPPHTASPHTQLRRRFILVGKHDCCGLHSLPLVVGLDHLRVPLLQHPHVLQRFEGQINRRYQGRSRTLFASLLLYVADVARLRRVALGACYATGVEKDV